LEQVLKRSLKFFYSKVYMSVAVGLTFREEGFGSGEKLKTREK
jgi:hypothetical protein